MWRHWSFVSAHVTSSGNPSRRCWSMTPFVSLVVDPGDVGEDIEAANPTCDLGYGFADVIRSRDIYSHSNGIRQRRNRRGCGLTVDVEHKDERGHPHGLLFC
jgi:hypothetical protein